MQALDVKLEPEVKEALISLGRTEDVCLCPDRRRLAIAGFKGNVILLLEVAIDRSASGVSVSLADPMQVTSPELSYPHGLDFLDPNTLIVANRTGSVTLLPLPERGSKLQAYQAGSLTVDPSDWTSLLRTPGSVTVWRNPDESFSSEREIFICNNYANTVTRHHFSSTGQTVARSEVLLHKWLSIPDGISVSPDGLWIAVSNHDTHCVLIYKNTAELGPESDPVGILRRVWCPHGLRFSPDGRHLFVADAGRPHVLLYSHDGSGWEGVYHPARTLEVMDPESFAQGHVSDQEGGPKGIALDMSSEVMVVSSEFQPLDFFDISEFLTPPLERQTKSEARSSEKRAELAYELMVLRNVRNGMLDTIISALRRRTPTMFHEALDRLRKRFQSFLGVYC